MAEKYFLPIRQKVDTNQPTFDGEKVPQNGLAGYTACLDAMQETLSVAGSRPELRDYADALEAAIATLKQVTEFLLGSMLEENIDLVLDDTTYRMQADWF